MVVTRQTKGREGESLAAKFLEERGVVVVDRNIRCPLGEIDLVGRDGRVIVFVEVRSRFSGRYGSPQESVSRSKQKRLTRLAQWYLKKHRLEGRSARFDVVAITWKAGESDIAWIVNAFEARE